MTKREIFVRGIFATLEKKDIPYIVIRNFESVFTGHDIDILSAQTGPVLAALQSTAKLSGYTLVQDAQFVNRSLVWWDGEEDFLRIDIETSVRWRIFCTMPTAKILSARVKHDDFWIPSPEHEAECLRIQLASCGKSEARYLDRLRELGYGVTDPTTERRRLARRVFVNPEYLFRAARFMASDTVRLIGRLREPVGAIVFLAGSENFPSESLRRKLALLFPTNKQPQDSSERASRASLFRGGLVIRKVSSAGSDKSDGILLSTRIPGSAQRQFQLLKEPDGCVQIAHRGTGFMREVKRKDDAVVASEVAEFMCHMMARGFKTRTATRGATLLLLGVDGAGKTTVARRLIQNAGIQERFSGARYFHWIPSRKTVFPWPVLREQPRNTRIGSPAVSIVRLLRNLLRARLAWLGTVEPLVRDGHFVILDRFMANYWLDPLSVRYAGPGALLAGLEPFVPRADLMAVLDAPAEIILSRKQELSAAQIEHQREQLRTIPLLGRRRLDLDASETIDNIVAIISREITGKVPAASHV